MKFRDIAIIICALQFGLLLPSAHSARGGTNRKRITPSPRPKSNRDRLNYGNNRLSDQQNEIFHYTSQLVDFNNLTESEKSEIIQLKDEPFLSSKNLSLLRCSLYRFTFKIYQSSNRNEIESKTKIIQTPTAVPKSTIILTSPFGKSLELIWNTNYPECVSNYTLTIIDLSNYKKREIFLQNGTSYEVDGLIPCTNYNIQLDTYDLRGLSNSTSVDERTSLANIEPEEFRYSIVADNSIRFNWTRLRDIERCDGDYFVTLTPLDEAYAIVGDHHTPYTTNEVTVSGLKSCMRYNATLNANYFDKVAAKIVTSSFAKPSNIYGLKMDEKRMLLEWNHPIENPYCVANYSININGTEEVIILKNELNLDKFERCENYSIAISLVDHTGEKYEPLEMQFEMNFDVLSIELSPTYSMHPENQTLIISWDNLELRSLCGLEFELTWKGEHLMETYHNYYLIDDLEFCRENVVEIRIIYGTKSHLYQHDVHFGAEFAKSVRNMTYAYDEYSDEIVFSWEKQKGFENCNFSYIVETDQFQASVDEETYSVAWEEIEIPFKVSIVDAIYGRSLGGQEILVRSEFPTVTKIKHQNNDKDGSTKISWTKPDTTKKVKHYVVILDSDIETTTQTSITRVFTKCLDLEVVIYVQYQGNNQVSANSTYDFKYIVAPEPIINLSHQFEFPNYKLIWDTVDKNVYCYKTFVLKTGKDTFLSENQEYIFTNWSDDEEYKFEVTAQYDDSHKSKALTHSFNTPGPVKNLNIIDKDDNTALLEWTPPGSADHVPVNYAISLNGVNNKTTSNSKITMDSIEYCVDLSISIVVIYDSGVIRSAIFTRRISKAPGPISNIRLATDSRNASKLTLTWDAPKVNPSCANIYQVKVNSAAHLSNATRLEFTGWEPCYHVNVTILGQNTNGDLGQEKSKTFATPTGSISTVNKLELVPTEKTLKINWDEPEQSRFCVTGYRVVVWDVDSKETIYDHENATMFLVLEEMKACRKIAVQVTPISKTGDGVLLTKETQILQRAAAQLTPVNSVETQSRQLKLSTLFDDEFYLCRLQEIKVTCVEASTDSSIVQTAQLGCIVAENNHPFEVIMVDLEPYETYTCSASVKNVHGSWSLASFNTSIQTLEDLPEKPTELTIVNRAHNALKFTWSNPLKPNGRITYYDIKVSEIHPLYYVPKHCQEEHESFRANKTTLETNLQVDDIRPHTLYKIKVRAVNGAGLGEETQIVAKTEPYIPAIPLDFKVGRVHGPVNPDEYSATTKITWKFPCSLNGEFIKFKGFIRGKHPNFDDTKVEFFMDEVRDDYEFEFKNLQASFDYEIHLQSMTPLFHSNDVVQTFRAPAAIPNFLATNQITLNMTVNPSESAVMNILRRDLLSSGTILYYAILISEMDCQAAPEAQRTIMDTSTDWPLTRSWYEVQSDDCQRQYQSTPSRYTHGLKLESKSDDHLEEEEPSEFLEIAIGAERCDETSTNMFCNGPLRSGTKYAVVLRLFTETGFTDNDYVIIETISTVNITLIGLLMLAFLSLAFLGGVMLILRKKNKRAIKELQGIDAPKKSNGTGDILTKNFPEHFEDLSKNNCERLNNEFSIINSGGQSMTYAVAKENGHKNRYTNVLPYDFNRVVLEKSDDAETDYINASFINGYRKPRDYIASQGPKMESSCDFWRMILQYKVSSIVMLTSYKEGDKDKCHEYFPANDSETILFNDVKIKCQKELDFPTHKKRVFSIEKNNSCHIVYHYHFLKWPDHSCPQDPHDLIVFTRCVASERRHPSNPMVVHCSAGVGRSGTFIALDIAQQQIRAEKKINVLDIVKELRRQRMKMVQSFSQYLLIYQCIVIMLKEYEAAHSGPIWKRLSKKKTTTEKKVNFSTHNFGMLRINSSKELNLSHSGGSEIPAAELLGTSSPDLLDNPSNSINLRAIPPMYPTCFEPEDSIT